MALAICCFSALGALAQVPSGELDFSFDSSTPVFDLTGHYDLTDNILGAGGAGTAISIPINLVQDARGRITGTGTEIMNLGSDFIAANYIVRGRIYGGVNATHVVLSIRIFGQDAITGLQTPFGITISYNLLVSPTERTLFGTSRGSARLGMLGGGRIRSDVQFPLPANMDGSWTARVNIIPLNRLAGSGTITFSNGRISSTRLSGSYSPSSGLAQINLAGLDVAQGNSVLIRFVNTTNGTVVERLRGTLLGQKVRR